jgi:hypothetical protein
VLHGPGRVELAQRDARPVLITSLTEAGGGVLEGVVAASNRPPWRRALLWVVSAMALPCGSMAAASWCAVMALSNWRASAKVLPGQVLLPMVYAGQWPWQAQCLRTHLGAHLRAVVQVDRSCMRRVRSGAGRRATCEDVRCFRCALAGLTPR